jgi:3-deoxy-D-manno-octulosonate 8-phosphate phosphatase (KDO 8-P phosphatase)
MKQAIDKKLAEKIKAVTILIMDVDGVLTDGRIIIDDLGNETKNFNVKDGHGLKMLMRSGIEVILMTGRTSKVVEHRARDLGIEEVHQGAKNKIEILEKILRSKKVSGETIAYMGDDLVDIPVFNRVGFSVAVADASEHAKRSADYVTDHKGGKGAVREVCEVILMIQGNWETAVARYEIA